MGYIAMAALQSRKEPEFFAPLSYGRGNEIAHDQLLQRGRAAMFASEKDALAALEKTLQQAIKDGAKWPRMYQYAMIEVENAQ